MHATGFQQCQRRYEPEPVRAVVGDGRGGGAVVRAATHVLGDARQKAICPGAAVVSRGGKADGASSAVEDTADLECCDDGCAVSEGIWFNLGMMVRCRRG